MVVSGWVSMGGRVSVDGQVSLGEWVDGALYTVHTGQQCTGWQSTINSR